MYKLPDEEFDRLCREAADRPEVDLPVQGWEKMRQRLDREMPEDRGRRRAWPFWIPFMLFLPFSLFYWKNQAGESLSASTAMVSGTVLPGTSNDRSPARPTEPEQGSPEKVSPEKGFREQSTAKPFAQQHSSPDPSAGNQRSSEQTLSSPLAADHSARHKPSSGRKLSSLHAADHTAGGWASQQPSTRKQASPDPFAGKNTDHRDAIAGQGNLRPVDQQKETEIGAKINTLENPVINSQDKAEITALDSPWIAANPVLTASGTKKDTKNKQQEAGSETQSSQKKSSHAKPVPAAQRGFGISLIGGPDWSNVQFSAPDKVGLMAGITVQYRFNRRWVIQSGLMYSRKHYTAAGEGRASYPGYDPNNPAFKMTKVEANCFMWDIPVNLRYDILAGDRRKFYAQLGFSSYLMGKEDLHYYYTWNNTPRYRGWENPVDKMYWFSEANLAIGYEHQLGRQWSVKLEPFLKLPIQAVGSGQVNLTSLGALAGITYTPRFRSSSTVKK